MNNVMYRLATEKGISEISELVKNAITQMETLGIYQWDAIYPTADNFLSDIKKQQLYVGILCGEITS